MDAAKRRRSTAVTIRDVASAADVSIATVSRVLRGTTTVSDQTRERVERAVRELDFTPSRLGRSLAEQHHAANGIVFPDLSGPYYAEVVLGYEEVASERGRSVLILSTQGRRAAGERVLDLAGRVDGMVILGRTVGDDVVHEVARRGIPVVVIARPPVAFDEGRRLTAVVDSVNAENAATAVDLAAHIVAQGARRPILVGDPNDSPDVAQRWHGLRQGFLRGGVSVGEVTTSGFSVDEGRRVAGEMVAAGDWAAGGAQGPDALVCANDELALGVLDVLHEEGIDVPGQVIVTGWDDVMAARWAGLTTVAQPMRRIGERAAQLLDERIGGTAPNVARHEVLSTHLVARTSSDRDTKESR